MKENKHWLNRSFSLIPKRTLKTQLKEQEEERRVMLREHKRKLDYLDWQIWLTKDNLSLRYKKLSGGWKRSD